MATATITSKGQVTIPKRVRERLHWKSGDRLEFSVDASGRVIVELAAGDIRDLRGILHRPGQKPVSVEEMNEAIRRHVAEKYLRATAKDRRSASTPISWSAT